MNMELSRFICRNAYVLGRREYSICFPIMSLLNVQYETYILDLAKILHLYPKKIQLLRMN